MLWGGYHDHPLFQVRLRDGTCSAGVEGQGLYHKPLNSKYFPLMSGLLSIRLNSYISSSFSFLYYRESSALGTGSGFDF